MLETSIGNHLFVIHQHIIAAVEPEHVRALISAINAGGFFKHMSMRITELGADYSVLAAEISTKHMNPFGSVHGGVYASLIDSVAYWSAYCELPQKSGLVTIDLKMDLLAPMTEGRIIVRGQRIKLGKTLCLSEAKIFGGNRKLLAHGTLKLMITRNQQSISEITDFIGSGRFPDKFKQN